MPLTFSNRITCMSIEYNAAGRSPSERMLFSAKCESECWSQARNSQLSKYGFSGGRIWVTIPELNCFAVPKRCDSNLMRFVASIAMPHRLYNMSIFDENVIPQISAKIPKRRQPIASSSAYPWFPYFSFFLSVGMWHRAHIHSKEFQIT